MKIIVWPRNWNVDGGRLQLQRVGDTLQLGVDFTVLGTRTYASRIAVNATSIIGSRAIDLGVSFDDMVAADLALQSPGIVLVGCARGSNFRSGAHRFLTPKVSCSR